MRLEHLLSGVRETARSAATRRKSDEGRDNGMPQRGIVIPETVTGLRRKTKETRTVYGSVLLLRSIDKGD